MNEQDTKNMAQWLQEILRLLQDSQTQITDLRSENRQLMDELKIAVARSEQVNKDSLKASELLRGQLDVLRNDVLATKNSIESTNSHIDSKISDLKSEVKNIKYIVR